MCGNIKHGFLLDHTLKNAHIYALHIKIQSLKLRTQNLFISENSFNFVSKNKDTINPEEEKKHVWRPSQMSLEVKCWEPRHQP